MTEFSIIVENIHSKDVKCCASLNIPSYACTGTFQSEIINRLSSSPVLRSTSLSLSKISHLHLPADWPQDTEQEVHQVSIRQETHKHTHNIFGDKPLLRF